MTKSQVVTLKAALAALEKLQKCVCSDPLWKRLGLVRLNPIKPPLEGGIKKEPDVDDPLFDAQAFQELIDRLWAAVPGRKKPEPIDADIAVCIIAAKCFDRAKAGLLTQVMKKPVRRKHPCPPALIEK